MLNVDDVLGVDLEARLLQHLFVIFNAKTDKGVQLLLLQELFEVLGPARGDTY
jgi:hypothetical protein